MTRKRQAQANVGEGASARFVETLARVLEMAKRAEASKEYRTAFRSELQALPSRAKERLGLLLTIGREAHDMAHVRTSPGAEASEPLDVLALCEGHTLSQRYLERGVAAVCAARMKLDTRVSQNLAIDRNLSVYERAWSRFGRELASSEPGDWSWFGCFKGKTRVLDKLYVRHGDSAWWCFAAGLDRPPRSQIDRDLKRSRSTRLGDHGSSLESLMSQEGSPGRRALRRALTSVHARLGRVGALS